MNLTSIRNLGVCLVVTLLFTLIPGARSQTITTGDITGTVTDVTGAIIPRATVTLRSLDSGQVRTVQTNEQGSYRSTFLAPGTYTVSVASAGLRSDTTRVNVAVGQVQTVDLTMRVAESKESVVVTDAAPAVQADNANLATSFTNQQIQNLPAPGGDITSVAFTVPGIVVSTGAGYGNFSSHGLPGTSNLFTINGNDYNDAYLNLNNSGASNLLLGQNEIAEASVVQNAYSVQYGRQAGAQVNYVTKSGTNAFHSSLVYSWNGDRLNANDFFNNANGVSRPRAVSNQYGASIGGPALRNKLFFFADAEGLRYVLPATGVVTLPSPALQSYILNTVSPSQQSLYSTAFGIYNNAPGASRAIPVTNGPGQLQDANNSLGCGQLAGTAAPGGGTFGVDTGCAVAYGVNGSNQNSEWLMVTRVDWNLNDRHKMYFRYKTDHGIQPTETNLINPLFNVQSVQPQHEGQINYTWVVSPTTVNNFIGSVLWYSAYFGQADINKVIQTFPTYMQIFDGGANGGGFYAAGSDLTFFPQGRNVGQLGLVDDFSVIKGKHTVKLGVNLRKNRITDSSLLAGTYGYYSFNSLADFASGTTNINTGSSYFQSFTPITAAHIRLYNLGLYAQDEWAIKSNLKLTFGMRFDRTANPLCLDKCFSRLTQPFTSSAFAKDATLPYNQSIQTGLSHAYPKVDAFVPQPRLGVVWSPGGGNKTVLRGGIGLFADLPPGYLVSSVFSNAPFPFSATIYDTPVGVAGDPASAAAAALTQFNAFKTGFFQGATLDQLNNTVPGGFSPFNYFSTPSKLSTPEFLEWSFEVQRQLSPKNVVAVTYSGNHGYNLLLTNPFANAYVNTSGTFTSFGNLPTTAPDARFLTVNQLTNNGISNFDGVTVQFRRSMGWGFEGQIGYTWSHALDEVSGVGLPYNSATSQTSLNTPYPRLNYSNADYDIRHSLVADFLWDTPWKFSNHILGNVLGNWTLGSKFFVRTGTPFSVFDSQLAGQVGPTLGGTILGTLTASGVNRHCGSGAVDTPCLQTSQFVASGSETAFGNLPRNSFYGPGYFDIDSSLYKNFNIREHVRFSIGAQAFNLLNHPNFASPHGNLAVPGFGTISATVSAPTSPYGSFQGSAVSGRVMVLTGRFQF